MVVGSTITRVRPGHETGGKSRHQKPNPRMQTQARGKKKGKKRKKQQSARRGNSSREIPSLRSIQPNQNSQVHKRIHHVRSEQRVDVVMTEVFGNTGPA